MNESAQEKKGHPILKGLIGINLAGGAAASGLLGHNYVKANGGYKAFASKIMPRGRNQAAGGANWTYGAGGKTF